ncbi:hypothetical protein [Microcystis aeruginosa]|uniref:hypothetical protein n=1 Tax=Microcystis aeruginosa TaxID=1126 RepID=UPI0018EF0FCC|nr:hypothetical protein [Microcystis aeruginosa]
MTFSHLCLLRFLQNDVRLPCYSLAKKPEIAAKINPEAQSTLDILKESGLIGCISAESDLSTNYKSVLKEGLKAKYDHR